MNSLPIRYNPVHNLDDYSYLGNIEPKQMTKVEDLDFEFYDVVMDSLSEFFEGYSSVNMPLPGTREQILDALDPIAQQYVQFLYLLDEDEIPENLKAFCTATFLTFAMICAPNYKAEDLVTILDDSISENPVSLDIPKVQSSNKAYSMYLTAFRSSNHNSEDAYVSLMEEEFSSMSKEKRLSVTKEFLKIIWNSIKHFNTEDINVSANQARQNLIEAGIISEIASGNSVAQKATGSKTKIIIGSIAVIGIASFFYYKSRN